MKDLPKMKFPKYLYTEDDILDWDVYIKNPPSRKSGTIKVKLIYKGRSKPIPLEINYDNL